jgi:hypothetical protein
LYARGETRLLREIEEFNRCWPEAEGFTIRGYLESIENLSVKEGEAARDIKDDEFSLAMPPEGVVKYLESWGYRPRVIDVGTFSPDPGGNAITGVNKKRRLNQRLTRYNRLCHWMYRHNGRIYC